MKYLKWKIRIEVFLEKIWDKDTTSVKSCRELGDEINIDIEKEIENKVIQYIKNNFSFTVIKEDNSDLRNILLIL